MLAGGGVAGRFLKFAFAFAPRFLKMATGAAGPSLAAALSLVSMSSRVKSGDRHKEWNRSPLGVSDTVCLQKAVLGA